LRLKSGCHRDSYELIGNILGYVVEFIPVTIRLMEHAVERIQMILRMEGKSALARIMATWLPNDYTHRVSRVSMVGWGVAMLIASKT